MAAVTQDVHVEHAPHGHEVTPAQAVRNNRLGLWLFCFSEVFLFVGLLASRFYLWRDPVTGAAIRPELDQTLGLITTCVLLVSSGFMAWAESAISVGDRRSFSLGMLGTFVLGAAFLAGVVGLEWGGHLRPTDGAFGAIFYGMTGIHAIHVLSGLVIIAIVWINGLRGAYTAEHHWGVEACAIYWHFVDVVWVFFYPAIYLIGTAVYVG